MPIFKSLAGNLPALLPGSRKWMSRRRRPGCRRRNPPRLKARNRGGRTGITVEAEARQYWQDMLNPGSLAKPDQEELRAAAMPVLARGLRTPGQVAGAGVLS